MSLADGQLELYSGNDDQVLPILSLGGLGVISVLSNVAPKFTHDMVMKYFDGDTKGATEDQLKALPLINALFSEVNPIPVKTAMNLMGMNVGPLRMPLCEMEEDTKAAPLQKEIAHWVITEQKHTEFKPFFRKKLSAYTAFSVFYAPDIGLDPIMKAKEIMEDEALCALLSEAELHGVFRCIVHCLKQQNLPALQLHLAAYRAAKHAKSILKGENTRALHSA